MACPNGTSPLISWCLSVSYSFFPLFCLTFLPSRLSFLSSFLLLYLSLFSLFCRWSPLIEADVKRRRTRFPTDDLFYDAARLAGSRILEHSNGLRSAEEKAGSNFHSLDPQPFSLLHPFGVKSSLGEFD